MNSLTLGAGGRETLFGQQASALSVAMSSFGLIFGFIMRRLLSPAGDLCGGNGFIFSSSRLAT
jgi:hypothetical protein